MQEQGGYYVKLFSKKLERASEDSVAGCCGIYRNMLKEKIEQFLGEKNEETINKKSYIVDVLSFAGCYYDSGLRYV